ncbi:Bromo-adjacent domain-containing protein, putative isoform 1 [Hibiscus syriacus]|uniref:Bromo-adjacent domain-containing protein, putative isoform 1 n=1 Tax=Hibiscus syriacus TaxID=106335 RepID=A0A6A3AAM1_HIBSY|nr:Bromo-adjacent domain-containing protein, putative isoform 1 [Hibiscus syriacus]
MVDDNMSGPSLDLDNNHNETDTRNANALENNVTGVGFTCENEIETKKPERPEKVTAMAMAMEMNDVKGKQPIQTKHSKTAPADFRRVVKVVSGLKLMSVLNEIDDHFLKSSENSQEVSKMLEATRVIDTVFPVEKCFHRYETHATVVDKLLAWEKKLYDEVKVCLYIFGLSVMMANMWASMCIHHDAERGEDENTKGPVSERQFAVESLKKRLEEEVEAHRKHCIQVREKSVGSLKIRLPEIFRAFSDYSHACSGAYEKLRAVTHSQNTNGAPL